MKIRALLFVFGGAIALLVGSGVHAGIVGITDNEANPPLAQRYTGGVSVLLIGNSAYVPPKDPSQTSSVGWSRLPGVLEDIAAVSSAFRRIGADVTVVEDASTAELRRAIRHFLQTNGDIEDRMLVLYYAGHGHAAKLSGDSPTGFLVGVDSPIPPTGQTDADLHRFVHREYYPLTDLFSPLAGVASRHVLVVIDSCFGGAVFESAASRIGDLSILGQGGHDGRVVQFLTSGEASERVPDQSAFRRIFVDGLAGSADADASGTVTGRELVRWVNTQSGRCKDDQGQPAICRGPVVTPAFGIWRVSGDPPGDFTLLYGTRTPSAFADVGTPFTDECTSCPELVRTPCHEAGPGHPLFVGTKEVTLAEWDACIAGRGCLRVLDGPSSGRAIFPASGVSFAEAEAFTRWLSCASGSRYRLPKASEMTCLVRGSEVVASAAIRTPTRAAVCDGCGGESPDAPRPVASMPANALGIHDLLGNLWEWTSDCTESNGQDCTSGRRVIFGGSYATPTRLMTDDLKGSMPESSRFPTLGFRVVRESRNSGGPIECSLP